ncbi:MAG: hypothetical protein K2Q25_11595 [Mycobacteriaceae bacterium]|nr:hypothetical protein [Mycobacteriaceae bacterium]
MDYVYAAQLLVALAALGQQFAFADDSDFTGGEYLSGSLTGALSGGFAAFFSGCLVYDAIWGVASRATLDGRLSEYFLPGDVGESDSRSSSGSSLFSLPDEDLISGDGGVEKEISPEQKAGSILDGNCAELILLTLNMVEFLELLTGFGPPEEGDVLNNTSDQFGAISGLLGAAFPAECWQSSAALNYVDQNVTQQDSACTMADLDTQLAALVKNQADTVTSVRLGFGLLTGLLVAAVCVVLWMDGQPLGGVLEAKAFAISASVLGLVAGLAMVGTVIGVSRDNADKADDLVGQYHVAAGIAAPDACVEVELAGVGGPTVSAFGAMSGSAVELAPVPELASLAALAHSRVVPTAASRTASVASLIASAAEQRHGAAVAQRKRDRQPSAREQTAVAADSTTGDSAAQPALTEVWGELHLGLPAGILTPAQTEVSKSEIWRG